MKVIVVFEFSHIKDPDSEEATKVVETMTGECYRMQVAFDASNCYVDDCIEGAYDEQNEGDNDD